MKKRSSLEKMIVIDNPVIVEVEKEKADMMILLSMMLLLKGLDIRKWNWQSVFKVWNFVGKMDYVYNSKNESNKKGDLKAAKKVLNAIMPSLLHIPSIHA